ncbi:MAG: endonuclease/exonuclease/phosphatase family protein [Gemmataceae bacterium]
MRNWRSILCPTLVTLAILLWSVGQLFRDATWLTGLCFYIPSPLLALFLLLLAGWLWRKRRRWAMAMGLAALMPASFVVFIVNQFWTSGSPADSLPVRLVHWNVWNGRLGWEAIQADLVTERADIYVLSEAPEEAERIGLAHALGPEFTVVSKGDLAIVARGQLDPVRWLAFDDGVKALLVRWHAPRGSCAVLVVDLASSLSLPREPRLRRVGDLMVRVQADIVVGDFNAPRRSRALSPLPAGYVHAYDAAGQGWSYTWPMPCPVYAIDQCMVGPRVRPLRYQLRGSWRSDHRCQVLDFAIVPPAEPLP